MAETLITDIDGKVIICGIAKDLGDMIRIEDRKRGLTLTLPKGHRWLGG